MPLPNTFVTLTSGDADFPDDLHHPNAMPVVIFCLIAPQSFHVVAPTVQ
jgi:hypothetical protein